MSIKLPPLPYEVDALEPHISAETLKLHHGKHHKAYVDHLNETIVGTAYETQTLETIVATSREDGDIEVFKNAAQAWNHGFYWNCLSGRNGMKPSAELASAIDKTFGSTEALMSEMQKAGEKHFGSGWVWLIIEDGVLNVVSTHDAETPIAYVNHGVPLLTIDVWEHAYYVDWKNERPKYLKALLANLVNWDFVNENFERKKIWSYPTK